jgi:hypothetical protein
MKRIAILAALLIAVTAYGGNLAWNGAGDVAIQSHDRVVVIALDTNGDGSPDRAFVAGIEKALDKPVELHWPHASVELSDDSLVITDAAHHRAFVATTKESRTFPDDFAVTRIPHVIGVAHYWGLRPDFKLESLSKNWM